MTAQELREALEYRKIDVSAWSDEELLAEHDEWVEVIDGHDAQIDDDVDWMILQELMGKNDL